MVEKIRRQVADASGAFRSIRGTEPKFEVTLERGTYEVLARIDGEGRFTTLRLSPGVATLEAVLAGFRALPGKASVLVLTDGKERAAFAADEPLAVGSAFKLSILAALRKQIDAKKHRWNETVELDPSWKSLPSGKLQDFPARAPLTLDTLASLMISISDNTATDALLAIVGRAAADAEAPPRVRPLLSTSDMFKLRANGAEPLVERWRTGDEKARRQLVADLARRPLPSLEGEEWTAPRAIDVEWLYTVRETCALMAKVHDLPLMSINPGAAKKADWDRIAYKGGSEPGVVNMTTWVEKNGRKHCVSATWNDPSKPLDTARFYMLVEQALATLGGP
jgi:beta-lactamase class A